MSRRWLLSLSVLLVISLTGAVAFFGMTSQENSSTQLKASASQEAKPRGFYTLSGSIYSNASAVRVNAGSCLIFWSWRDNKDYLRVCPADGTVQLNRITNLHPLNKNQTWADWITDYRLEDPAQKTSFVLFKDNPFQKPVEPYFFNQ